MTRMLRVTGYNLLMKDGVSEIRCVERKVVVGGGEASVRSEPGAATWGGSLGVGSEHTGCQPHPQRLSNNHVITQFRGNYMIVKLTNI